MVVSEKKKAERQNNKYTNILVFTSKKQKTEKTRTQTTYHRTSHETQWQCVSDFQNQNVPFNDGYVTLLSV